MNRDLLFLASLFPSLPLFFPPLSVTPTPLELSSPAYCSYLDSISALFWIQVFFFFLNVILFIYFCGLPGVWWCVAFTAAASVEEARGSRCAGFRSCGIAGSVVPCGIWDLPRPGIQPTHPHWQVGSYTCCATKEVLDPVLILGEDYTVLSSLLHCKDCAFIH